MQIGMKNSHRRHNVLLLTSSLSLGGAEQVIANLARYLDRSRFNVTICHLKDRGLIGERLEEDGYDVVGVERVQQWPGRYFSFLKLSRIIRDRSIGLIHSHTTYSLIDSSFCKLINPGIKTLHTFHYGNYPHVPRKYLLSEGLLCRVPNRLIAVGVEQGEIIRRTYHLADDRVTVVPNGVEPVEGQIDEDIKSRLSGKGKIVIGTICTLIEQKGVTYLLDAAHVLVKERPDVVFVIVGEGHLRNVLEKKMRSLGLQDHVFFTGWKVNAATTILPLFDIFFQPSLWEAMSVVVLEAMAKSKPMVVTDVGDNRHVVINGETGLLVSPRDVPGMVRALLRVVDSPALRDQLGRAAKDYYDRHYTAEQMACAYAGIYSELLDQ